MPRFPLFRGGRLAVLYVHKELAKFALVHNLLRRVMLLRRVKLRAAQRQDAPLERISFIDAMR